MMGAFNSFILVVGLLAFLVILYLHDQSLYYEFTRETTLYRVHRVSGLIQKQVEYLGAEHYETSWDDVVHVDDPKSLIIGLEKIKAKVSEKDDKE
ncbi:MAG: hypothetical protein ACTSRU_11015, partial [Candidatus Hodarchaeales archaeon]